MAQAGSPNTASCSPRILEGKTALITGGVGGLGLGCARRYAALGADLILADIAEQAWPAAAAALAPFETKVEFLRLDLTDAAAINGLAESLRVGGRPLDILVNNAGIYPSAHRRLGSEGVELTLTIAHLGHFRLTHALWPLLAAAPAARIITVSSLTQSKGRLALDDLAMNHGYTPIGAYARAKLANLLFARELQRRLDQVNATARSYAVHPGVTRSQLGQNRDRSGDKFWHQRVASTLLAYWQARSGLSPENGAESLMQAAISETYAPGAFIGPTGMLQMYGHVGLIDPGHPGNDPSLGKSLWEVSEALTGIRWAF